MRNILLLFIFLFSFSCKNSKVSGTKKLVEKTEVAESSSDISAISTKDFRDFKVLDSENLTKTQVWEVINPQLEDFTEEDYNRLKPFIIEQDIKTLQNNRRAYKFTYEELTKFYLYRIRKYDRENSVSLNSVIAINPNAILQAKQNDEDFLNKKWKHPIFGMPILLKDNVNASGMPTTAGAVALKDNVTKDAFIVKQLKSKGALIIGKALMVDVL